MVEGGGGCLSVCVWFWLLVLVVLTAGGSGVVIVASPRQGRAEGLFSGRVEPGWKLKDRDVVGDVERGGGGAGGGCTCVGLGYKGSAVAGAAAAKAHAPSSCRRALFLLSLFLCGGLVAHMHRWDPPRSETSRRDQMRFFFGICSNVIPKARAVSKRKRCAGSRLRVLKGQVTDDLTLDASKIKEKGVGGKREKISQGPQVRQAPLIQDLPGVE